MPWNNLHKCHESMLTTLSFLGKGMYVNPNNRKGERDLGKKVLQTQSVFHLLVSRKKILLEYRHRIKTDVDVVLEVLEVQINVVFEFCLDEEFIP